MLLLIVFALIAGAATALAPCVLPALPFIVGGSLGGGRRRPLGIAAGVVTSFTVFTLGLSTALREAGVDPDVLRWIAVAVLAAFGLALIVPRLDRWLSGGFAPLTRLADRMPRGGDGFLGGFALGGALGLAWTPCAGPILAGITATVATVGAGVDVALVLLAYAIGAAIPLLIIGYGGRRLAGRIGPYSGPMRQGMGVLMVAAAVTIAVGLDVRLTATALANVPGYESTLQRLERSDTARDQLAQLQGLPTGEAPLVEAARGSNGDPGDALGLPNAGPPPPLQGISNWFNSEPLTFEELRGKVVIVDFWTYSCVNCVRTIPHLRALYDRYHDQGLEIVGVHTPEFAFEADPDNVADGIDDLGVTWPVALDPDYATWQAFRNQYWPAKYLIDRDGDVRDLHIGEGGYHETEQLVRALLETPRSAPLVEATPAQAPAGHTALTPESYLGHERIDRFASPEAIRPDAPADYSVPFALETDQLAYDGRVTIEGERLVAGDGAAIELNFTAKDVFLVLASEGRPRNVRVFLDGEPIDRDVAGEDVDADGNLAVSDSRLYTLVRLPKSGQHRLRLELDPGVEGYAFTFG